MTTPIRPRPNQQLMTHIPPGLTCYRISDVAQVLNCTYDYVWKLVKHGHLKSIRISPSSKRSTIRIPESEVLNLIKPQSQ